MSQRKWLINRKRRINRRRGKRGLIGDDEKQN